jgi:hypothetical protein
MVPVVGEGEGEGLGEGDGEGVGVPPPTGGGLLPPPPPPPQPFRASTAHIASKALADRRPHCIIGFSVGFMTTS